MSGLASQLAQNASLNSALLVDRSRRKPVSSYLFTGREADQHDLEAIHALGVNSLIHLSSIEPALAKYEDVLFSDLAKSTDRTLLSADASRELDKSIEEFLLQLSPYLMEAPSSSILEWLVRRFRINEFNVEATLALFLPYHESPHFAKMVTILHIQRNSTWSFLLPYKSAGQKLPRVSLVTEMLKNTELARFVTSLLPTAIKNGFSHRVLLAFNAAALHEFITRSKVLDEGTMAYLLPALLEPLQQKSSTPSQDSILGSYILLVALSQKYQFSTSTLKVIVSTMVACAHMVRGDQLISSLVAMCDSQDELERLSDKTLKAILRIPNIGNDLVSAASWSGSERMLCPLVKCLAPRLLDEASVTLLEKIIAASNMPSTVIVALTTSLMKDVLNPTSETQTVMTGRRLLSLIQPRHPSVLQKVAGTLSEADESVNDAVEQLVISLSMMDPASGQPSRREDIDMILASSSADVNVRLIAVKELTKSISGEKVSSLENMESIRNALLSRLQDSNILILEALYENPATITPIISSDPQAYISSLSLAIGATAKPKRNVLRLHLTYLASHFWTTADVSIRELIFHQFIFPFLLFSRPRQKTAELVWEIIGKDLSQPLGTSVTDWLAGCAALVKAEETPEGDDSVEGMNRINLSISAKIAENILSSDRFSTHFDTLMSKLTDSNPYISLMSHLIGLGLIRKLSGEHQLEVAHTIVDAMKLEQLSGIDDFSQGQNTLESFANSSFEKFTKYVIMKPNSKTALHCVQIAIIAAISQIARPSHLSLNWLMETNSMSVNRGHYYVHLMRRIYHLANVSTTLPVLASTLLQALFTNFKDDALAFLAGIWSTSDAEIIKESRGVTLLHAAAFLEAHILEDDGVDFQTILPPLLVALQDSDAQICQGALECISRIWILSGRRLSSVYRFDTVYGDSEQTLQYLGQEDLKRYLNALVEHRDHFSNDPSYLKTFHEQHLIRAKSDKKRDADYKHGVVCYLLSHINACSSEFARTRLLNSIATIPNRARSQILLPTIQALTEKATSTQPTDIFVASSEMLTIQLLSCFDVAAAAHLNENPSAWNLFLLVLRTYLRAGTPQSTRQALVHVVRDGLFSSLNQQRKIAACEVLLEIGSQTSSGQSSTRDLLSSILVDVPLIVHLLGVLAPAPISTSPRASKRAKTMTTESSDDTLPRLSLLVEILGTKSLPGSLDLISCLLDTLNKVVQSFPSAQADVSYIEQLLMSAVESVASKITEAPNLSPSVIRLDILVELIRVSGNPQTFNQALLLMANLARLAPESVLYNIMPVFTFMGSNVFHRDDTYSFKVVQQTIDGIVPVMASSLKLAHTQHIDLYIASKEFLRVFTDAANHIPRHRRNNFFAHLVDVLGAKDFLAPVTMLLLEKMANRIVRQPAVEVPNTLSLQVSIFQHNSYSLQIHTAKEILNESLRLVDHVVDPNSIQPIFLESTTDGDHSLAPSTNMKRRAQALILFVGYALKPRTSPSSEEEPISTVMAPLITLATLTGGKTNDTKVDEISEAARLSMNRLLSGMSVANFMESVESMLKSGDVKIQAGALELLGNRLPDVSVKMRSEIAEPITLILVSIKNLLAIHKGEDPVVLSAFRALKAIAATLCSGEEGSMAELVPHALSASKGKQSTGAALGALAAMSTKLGPRIIPFFRSIISHSIAILRGEDDSLFEDAFSILHGLLTTIPTFWGSGEVTQVVLLHMDQPSHISSMMSSLVKSIAKRIPSKVLLPTLVEIWLTVQPSGQSTRISAYFEVVARALQHADRSTVMEHLRSYFKNFLEALDFGHVDEKAETRVILAFKELVVKLNEAVFRPLFRRLYDWAFTTNSANDARRITFNHLYIALLDFFKGLMVPYMSFLLQPYTDILKAFTSSTSDNFALWSSVIQTLTRALNFDDCAFWRDDKLRQVSIVLTGQIEVCIRLNFADGKPLIQECFGALLETITDDTLLKSINMNILMHTRSEDPRVRLFALACSETLWRSQGGKLIGFTAETATFIVECSEDENDMVVKESFKLKDAVESVSGKIDGL
ncbi:hypothetical protein BYT27DRAFT_7204423 [Phlegmacium glaucopus]|nr:hypothetical protein BYT27DRAFT_7204423 [Phlegmacium glaucopus]